MAKHSELALGHACGCVPLRIAVYLFLAAILVDSFFMAGGLVTEDTRVFVGGYTNYSRASVALLGLVGIFLSYLGFVGVYDSAPPYIKSFIWYSVVRLVSIIVLFLWDHRTLWDCEDSALTMYMSTRSEGYNYAVDVLSVAGACGRTRRIYTELFLVDLALSAYGTFITYNFWVVSETCPIYLIHIEERSPLKIYTGYASWGMAPAEVGAGAAVPDGAAAAPGATA